MAHDYEDAAERQPLTIEEGFAHLASDRVRRHRVHRRPEAAGLRDPRRRRARAAGIRDRSLVSSTYKESLARLRAYDHELRVGWSVPRARRDYTSSIFMKIPALVVLSVMKRTLPRQAAQALRAGLCDAVMAHWRLVTPALVETVTDAGGDLYVWTVDHAPRIQRAEDARRDGRDHERPAPVRRAAVALRRV